MSNVYAIGNALVTEITELLVDLSDDVGADTTISRAATLPAVSLRKRRNGSGRDTTKMRINEGITIVPMKPRRTAGDNDRDGVAYRFLIAVATGTYKDLLTDTTDANDWLVSEYEEAIRRRFHNKRIGSITNLTNSCEVITQVEPGDLPDWAELKDGIDASFLVLTEHLRENRRDDS